jgi:hypothetical protein
LVVPSIPAFQKVRLTGVANDFLVITNEKELIDFATRDVLVEGATHCWVGSDGFLLFAVAHGQQFVRYKGRLVRVGEPALIVGEAVTYGVPAQYEVGEFELVKTEFLPKLLLALLEDVDEAENVVRFFLKTRGLLVAVAHTMEAAFDQGLFGQCCLLLDRFPGDLKVKFLVVTLCHIHRRYWPVVKDLLPPYETLVADFPETQNVIKQAYDDE